MICISILARDTEEALSKMRRAESLADLFELRMDAMTSCRPGEIISRAPRPVIATYRSRQEGGNGIAEYSEQVSLLSEALDAGAHYVDVEHRMAPDLRMGLLRKRGSSRIIISCHLLHETPPAEELDGLFHRLADTGADIVKIVSLARNPEDNLRIMGLIPLARSRGIPVIAFCMGPVGRVSRLVSPLLGGFLTFAALTEGEESAPGQMTALEMRNIMKVLMP